MTLRRRRTLPPVSPKTPTELKPLIAAMTEIMEVGEGVRGDPLDQKITFRDLLDSGIGKLRDGMRPGDGALINPALPPAPDLATPPSPAGFTAQGSFYGMINLSWQIPGQQYRIHAATNIYRSEVDNFANAEIIGREAGAFYTDYVRDDAIDPDDPTQLKGYYYWITFTSIHDVEGPPNDTAGTYAQPIADVGYVMELITERIDKGVLATELRQEIDSITPIRDDLLGKVDGVRDDLILKSNELGLRIDGEVARLDAVEDNLSGPETIDGTVANRIADERAARIAGLDAERDERIVATQYEADARADAIQAEAQARGEQIFQVQTQFELEQGYFASQLDVVAAAYQANTATTYSLEEVRVTDSEATATRINGLEVQVDDNKASIIEEQTVRASETSALASQVSVLSAKLDALPTFANGFEAGVEFDRWTVPTGHTLVAESSDYFQGSQAALVGSTEVSVATGTVPFGVSIALAAGTGDAFAGRRLRIGLAAKAVSGGSTEYAAGYATSDGWFSGWQMQTPQSLWAVQETLVDVPDTPGLDHYIVLWGDTSGGGGEVKLDRLLVEVANTEIPEITAQIENIQQAFVDTEQALAEDITNLQSVYDTQIADIQNTQTTLATDTQALAQDIQTLTVTTDDLSADIQFESTVRANETEALAQDVSNLWLSVGDSDGSLQSLVEANAEEDYFRGLMQDVIQANVATSAATITSIKEVVVEKDSLMARNVEGVEGRVAEAEGAVTDIMQLNIDPGSVLATRFSSIEVSVVEAEGKITSIENLDISEDSVLASRLTKIDGKIGDAEAGVTDIQTLNLSEDTALLTRFNSIDARIGTAEGEITQAADLIVENDRISGFIQDVISASTGVSSAAYRSMVDVVVEKDSVVASRLEELAGDVGSANGRITNIENLDVSEDSVLLTKLTELEANLGDLGVSYNNIISLEVDETSALGQRLETLGTAAEFTYDLASVSITGDDAPPLITRLIGVETDTGNAEVRIGTVEDTVGTLFTAKVEENGLIGGFGIFNDGEIVDAGFDVDRFWVGRTDTNAAGYRVKPFIIDDGTVFIDTAMIRDASIQEGQLGPISIGKFFFENPITGIEEPVTTVGGLIRADSIDVDNLSVAEAARFYGNVQSGNYIPGEAGWLINQAGDVEFNEGTFNGTVEFRNVSGAGALASKSNLDYTEVAGTKPPSDADKTSDNTAADTTLVAGMDATTVRVATGSGIVDPGFNHTVQGGNFWETSGSASIADRTTYGPSVYFNPSGDSVGQVTAVYDGGKLQRVTVKPGQTVGVSFTGRASSRNSGSSYAYFRAAVYFADSNDNYISAQSVLFNYDNNNLINTSDNPDGPIKRFQIADYVGAVAAPSDAASCYIRFQVRNMQFHLLRLDVDAVSASRTWVRPNSTLIDGNKIFTGDAYVDTLQIKGQAVTIASGSSFGGSYDAMGSWQEVRAFNFDPQGAPVVIQVGFGYEAESRVGSEGNSITAHINARILVDGNVVHNFGVVDSDSVTYYSSEQEENFASVRVSGNWASLYRDSGWSGAKRVSLEFYGGGTVSASVDRRFLLTTAVRR